MPIPPISLAVLPAPETTWVQLFPTGSAAGVTAAQMKTGSTGMTNRNPTTGAWNITPLPTPTTARPASQYNQDVLVWIAHATPPASQIPVTMVSAAETADRVRIFSLVSALSRPLTTDGVDGTLYNRRTGSGPTAYDRLTTVGDPATYIGYSFETPSTRTVLLDDLIKNWAEEGNPDPPFALGQRASTVDIAGIFSLSEMRTQLREPDVANEKRDTVIQAAFRAGAAWVMRETGIPILDETKQIMLHIPFSSDDPQLLPDTHVKEVTGITYWTQDGNLSDEADGSITLGRLQALNPRDHALLVPPRDGWPSNPLSNGMIVSYTRGVTDVSPALRSAIILIAVDLYDGAPEIKPTAAVNSLIAAERMYL